MVKRGAKASKSEEEDSSQLINENEIKTSEPAKKRLKAKSLYRQPTVNELNRLQETENLFNSNLFRLQIEEILEEVKLKEKHVKKIQTWLEELKKHLQSIPEDDEEYNLSEKTLIKKLKVKLPVNNHLDRTRCTFQFHKFKDIEIVGSYALGCAINSKLVIDVQITVPAETYTKNDSLNYRYHKKRAAYLAYIASHLKKLETIEELKYSWLNGCQTKPVLDVTPIGKLGNHCTVRINLICDAEAYKLHRFSPGRNNLREAWLLAKESENNSDVGPPTPYYNSSVLSDLTAAVNQDFLKEALSNSENLKQAVILLKIWLRQRRLQVSGFVIGLLVAYLVQTKRINNIMSSYQIIRNVWISLKTSEWNSTGISINKDSPVSEYHAHFPVVFLDRTGSFNICYQMTSGTYAALKREAALAVDMLDDGTVNGFIPLFMTPVTPLMQYDYILRFKNFPKLKQVVIDKAPIESKLNYGIDELALVTGSLHQVLAKGLGARADLILELVDADFSWPVGKSYKKVKDGYKESLAFGIILNPERALDIVDKGPAANLPEAEEFRAFWGDKSELRRFQDGSITETCVWEGDSLAERRTIARQIVDYLIQLKYDIPPTDLFHVLDQLASLTTRKRFTRETRCESEESALAALRACDELRTDLRGLTQLPLDVSAVYGTSPVFSYSEPFPPLPAGPHKPWRRGGTCLIKDIEKDGVATLPEYTPVCETVIELGHSGKWPGELEAFRCLKAAFHLQIADRLNKQFNLPTQAYATHIDVLKNGLVFRLVIAHPKEITLLRREVENGVVKFKESEESIKLQCDTVLMPRLRGALHGLHQRHPSFGPAVSLFKRWLSSHLLGPHFPPSAAELVAARVYTHTHPHGAPTQPQLGFLRTLRGLSDTDWAREMVVLDFNGDMKREEILKLESKFASREASAPYMHIVTSYDGGLPGVWTAPLLRQTVLRAQALARNTLKYMEDSLVEGMVDNVLSAFVPSYAGYDVLIHLQPSLSPYRCERVDVRPERRAVPPAGDVIPVVGFNPVQNYLDELQSAFSEFALFFHDTYGGEVIAVLWKPDISSDKEFQVSNASALRPLPGGQYRVDTAAIVEDFKLMGEGLVARVTVNT
ncbi:nucleolar protein 6 Mat89Ba [Choristoneura fumiferana]|uniref:nucleolar protein 6 Mat89Ba n=1 Tax=Choristoneura fumiferana TaxID=7141 RepID=UPI003D15EF87